MYNEHRESIDKFDEHGDVKEQYHEFVERSKARAASINHRFDSHQRVIGFFNGRYIEE
jgi:hypothetical protein